MTERPSPSSRSWPILLAAAVIVLAGWAAYRNSFSGPFIFDDGPAIVQNPTIRHLSPLRDVLSPPRESGLTVNGRPLLNLSLALNYAVGALRVEGYHRLNLAIHLLAGLALFGVVRRSFQQPLLAGRFGTAALPLALCVALLWILHPLQTAAVTYVVQRAESLVGLCYLLTLYAFIRGAAAQRPWAWYSLCVLSCTLGMLAKEVMVSAPLLVLLYDRTFVAGSFGRAWRERKRVYAALGSTWLLLGWLVLHTGSRGGTAGFDIGLSWQAYALTQFPTITHYLRLALWPFPLVLDYGGAVLERSPGQIVPSALIVLTLLVLAIAGLRRQPVLGFLGCWFFAILAPSSSVVPLADTMFEHRMYLPLAALIALFVAGIYLWTGKKAVSLLLILSVAFGILTLRRNEDYRSELSIWADTVTKRPENARAHYTLGTALRATNRAEEAIVQYDAALQLKPASIEARNNLGTALVQLGRLPEAIQNYETVLSLDPREPEAHNNLGNALVRLGRISEATSHYSAALQARPGFADAHNNFGSLLAQQGHLTDAIAQYEAALQADPNLVDAEVNLGNALAQSGRLGEALAHYEAALQLRPDSANLHYNLGTALALMGRLREAASHYEETLRLKPDHAQARANLTRLQTQLNARPGN